MYVLPRALESAWSGARKRAWVPLVPFGETILGAAAMAMVMDAYKVRAERRGTFSLTTAARTRCHVRDCQKIIIPVGRTGVKIIISTGGDTCNHNVATQIVNQKECAWIDYKLHQNTSLYQTLEGTPLRQWWAWFRARKCR